MNSKIALIKYRAELQQELKQAEMDHNNEKTSHIVHLAVSVFTGVWVIGWMIASHTTTKRKQKLMLDIKEIRKELVDVDVALAESYQNEDIPKFLFQ
ncbi:hypothetical protein L4D13_23205 [Photobacterium profundum]|uniref:hypothetical protein n=1 Tax=Photobacterium profundum TaxID=74109 RepID=UPI003D11C7C1